MVRSLCAARVRESPSTNEQKGGRAGGCTARRTDQLKVASLRSMWCKTEEALVLGRRSAIEVARHARVGLRGGEAGRVVGARLDAVDDGKEQPDGRRLIQIQPRRCDRHVEPLAVTQRVVAPASCT